MLTLPWLAAFFLTDLPVILSGEYMGILDPHTHYVNERNDDGSQRTGLKFTLNELQHQRYNHLKPFDGLFGFSHGKEDYNGTLFRFPFRTKESSISDKKFSPPQVLKELCSCLKSEASRILLFLRHVTCIEIYSRNDGRQAKPMLELVGKVSLDVSSHDEVRKAQRDMDEASAEDRGCSVSVIYPCTVCVEGSAIAQSPQKYHWMICQTLGSENVQLKHLAKDLRVSPWVGTAVPLPKSVSFKRCTLNAIQGRDIIRRAVQELQAHLSSAAVHSLSSDQECEGRTTDCVAFCFLPLPQATGLPVNVHGYFIPVDDRQRIKWPVGEKESDREAWWNLLLVRELLIPTYGLAIVINTMLFRFVASPGSVECPGAYAMWPLLKELRNVYVWQFLLVPDSSLLRMLISAALPVFWSPLQRGTWVDSRQAIFTLTKEDHTLASLLLDLGMPVVYLPQTIVESIQTDWLPQCLTPQMVHSVLCKHSEMAAQQLKRKPKLLLMLLKYLLSSLPPEALFDLPIIPLEDQQYAPAILKANDKERDQIYVIEDDLTASVLRGLGSRLLCRSLPSEISHVFTSIAESQQSQLRIPTKQQVCTSLLPQSLATWGAERGNPKEWTPGVNGQPGRHYLASIWQWLLQPEINLNDVCGLPLVPTHSLDRDDFVEGTHLLPLVNDGSIMRVNWQETVSVGVYQVTQKLGCCLVENYSQFHHHDLAHPSALSHFLPLVTPAHFLAYLQRCSGDIRSKLKTVEVEEKRELSIFLCKVLADPTLTPADATFLKSLPLYETVKPCVFVALDAGTSGSLIFPQPHLSFLPDSHLSGLILKTTNQNVRDLSKLLQRQPDSLASIVRQHILPWVQQAADIQQVNAMLVWMLSQFDKDDRDLHCVLLRTKFLPSNVNGDCNLHMPSELFDPSDLEVLNSFYTADEAVFPHSDFWHPTILAKLLLLGLQQWSAVTSNKERFIGFMVERAQSVAKLAEVDVQLAHERSFHLLRLGYLANVSSYMEEVWHRTKHIRYLFCNPPPRDYELISLFWKGADFCTTPICPDQACLPSSKEGIDSAAIVGSVLPVVSIKANYSAMAASFKAIEPQDVLSHVKNLVQLQDRARKSDEGKKVVWDIMVQVYKYFHTLPQGCQVLHKSNLPFIWNHNLGCFLRANEVAYEPIPGLSLQSSIKEMGLQYLGKDFWLRCGIRESSGVSDCIQALYTIKRQCEGKPELLTLHMGNIVRCLNEIVHMLSSSPNRDQLIGTILLPTKDAQFLSPLECVYDDRQWNEKGLSDYGPLVHSGVSSDLARSLGVSPLSSKIGKPQALKIAYQQKGQHEPLTRRLRRIIEDYKDNIDVFKELIQNADDAGATEVKFLLDWRQHPPHTDKLFSEDMKHWQGPALYAYNNSVFTDKDFDDICELAGATKKEDPTKIGRFGVGFCATYQLTDVPSFVSRNKMVMFDPHCRYLQGIVSHGDPGVYFDFVRERDTLLNYYTDQVQPFEGIFGFSLRQPQAKVYRGTLFRFPFRNQYTSSRSEIGRGLEYHRGNIGNLVQSLVTTAPLIPLFLQNVQSVELFELHQDALPSSMQPILSIKKTLVSPRVNILASYKGGKGQDRSIQQCTITVNSYAENPTIKTAWVVSSALGTGKSQAKASSPEGSKDGLFPFAEVALPVSAEGAPVCCDRGRVFCFLPLSIPVAPLRFHINGCFDISTDRRNLKELHDANSWNTILIEDAVVRACVNLLVHFTHSPSPSDNFLTTYYSIWPVGQTGAAELAGKLIPSFREYVLKENSKVLRCYKGKGSWESVSDVHVLGEDFKNMPFGSGMHPFLDHAVQILLQMGYSMSVLPDQLVQSFRQKQVNSPGLRCVSLKEYCVQVLLPNLQKLDEGLRNNQMIAILLLFDALQPQHMWLQDQLIKVPCVPCKSGKRMKKASELIDPRNGHFVALFKGIEDKFPLQELSDNEASHSALVKLGMATVYLRDSDIIECARCVLAQHSAVEMVNRSQYFLQYIDFHFKTSQGTQRSEQRNKLIRELSSVPFLPVHCCPEGTTFPWHQTKYPMGAPCDLFAANCLGSVFTVAGVVDGKKCSPYILHLFSQYFKQSPTVADMLQNLLSVTDWWKQCGEHRSAQFEKEKEFLTNWMPSLYKFLEHALTSGRCERGIVEEAQKKLLRRPFIWQDGSFLYPNQLVHSTHVTAPPFVIALAEPNVQHWSLFKMLGVAEGLNAVFCAAKLREMKQVFMENKIDENLMSCIVVLANTVADSNQGGLKPIFLPDNQYVLRSPEVLACAREDIQLPLQVAGRWTYFLHKDIPLATATALGVTDLLDHASSQMVSNDFFSGQDFGQWEDLTDRLNGILDQYEPNVSIFREFVQNAEDAGASEIAFVIDHRANFPDSLLFTEQNNWRRLQKMPSLLVFNNRRFSAMDLYGITKLGVGGKSGQADKIGRFGIGINVAYHVTDTPTFISYGKGGDPECFCLLDPNRSCLPKKDTPGRMWQSTPAMQLKNMTDQMSPFLADVIPDMAAKVPGCFQDLTSQWQNGYAMFRLPLTRCNPVMKWESKLMRGCAMTIQRLQTLSKQLMDEAPQMLVFLNNIRRISVYEISPVGNRISNFSSASASISQKFLHSPELFAQHVTHANSTKKLSESFAAVYTLGVNIQTAEGGRNVNDWIVSKQFGSKEISEDLLHNGHKESLLPVAGVAASTIRNLEEGEGQVFVYLPLDDNPSLLPVHVNGHFWVDPSRRHLQHTQEGPLKEWNQRLAESILAQCYSTLLQCCTLTISSRARLEWFYKLFPKQPPDVSHHTSSKSITAFNVVKMTYRYLLADKAAILPLMPKAPAMSLSAKPKWLALKDGGKEPKGYFCFHRDICQVLLELGFNVTDAPKALYKLFESVDASHAQSICVTQKLVIKLLKDIAPRMKDFEEVIKKHIHHIWGFLFNSSSSLTLNDIKGLPIMLTYDGCLSLVGGAKFLPNDKSICLVPKDRWVDFLSPKIFTSNVLRTNVVAPVSPQYIAQHIQLPKDGKPVELDKSHIPTLSHLWSWVASSHDGAALLKPHFCNVAVIPAVMSHPPKKVLLPVHMANFVLSKCQFVVLEKLGVPIVDFAEVSLAQSELKVARSVVDKVLAQSSSPDNILELLNYCSQFPQDLSITAEEIADFIAFINQGQLLKRRDTKTIEKLKCLPIFSVMGCRISSWRPIDKAKEVFLLPAGVNLEGLDTLQSELSILFITTKKDYADRFLNFFHSLGVQVLAVANFYQTVVIPSLHRMPKNTRVKQIHFVCESCKNTLPPAEHNMLMSTLSKKAFIGSGGNIKKVSDFFDPTESFVSCFLTASYQPPAPWNKPDQLPLLRQLGLKTVPDNELWLKCASEFCQSPDRYPANAAEVLLDSFVSKVSRFPCGLPVGGQQDKEMKLFLSEVSKLGFVPAEMPRQLSQVVKELSAVGARVRDFPRRITFEGSVLCTNDVQCETSVVVGFQARVITRRFHTKAFANPEYITSSLGIQDVTVALVCDNLLQLCDYVAKSAAVTRLYQLLRDIFFAHYKYLCARLSQHEELVKRKLFTAKCVFLENQDSKTYWLVKGSEVVEHLPSQQRCLSPYLQILPASLQQFSSLLKVLGLKQDPNVTHYIHVLQALHETQTRIPNSHFDLLRQKSIIAYESLVSLVREDEETAKRNIHLPIPLPALGGGITSSDQLVFSDAPWIQRRLPLGLMKYVSQPPPEAQTGAVSLPRCLGVKFLSDVISIELDPYIEDDNNQCMYELFAKRQGRDHGCIIIGTIASLIRSSEFARGVCRIIHNKAKRKPLKEEEDAILKVQQLRFMCVNEVVTTLSYRGETVNGSEQKQCCLLHKGTLFIACHSKDIKGNELLSYFVEELSKALTQSVESIHLSVMLNCSHPSQFEQAMDNHGLLSYVGSVPFHPGISVALSNNADFLLFSDFKMNDIVKYCQPDGTLVCARVVGVTPGLPPQLQLKASPEKTAQESSLVVCRQSTESEVGMLLSDSVLTMQEAPKVLCCPITESSIGEDLKQMVHSALRICNVKQVCFALERILFHLHYLCCVCYGPAKRKQKCGELIGRFGVILQAANPTGDGLAFIKNTLFREDKIVHLLSNWDISHVTGLYLHWSTCASKEKGQKGSQSVWNNAMETGQLERPSTSRMGAAMWVLQAENDLELATHLHASKKEAKEGAVFFSGGEAPTVQYKFPNAICFFCHEALEKSLKAIFFHYCGLPCDLQCSTDIVELYKQLQKHPKCPPEAKGLEEYVSPVNEHHDCCRYPDPCEGPPCLTHSNTTVNTALTATTHFFTKIRLLDVFLGNLELAAIPKSVPDIDKDTGTNELYSL